MSGLDNSQPDTEKAVMAAGGEAALPPTHPAPDAADQAKAKAEVEAEAEADESSAPPA